jgi:cell fate (sporulation/competence/biofilm development) regulator YlbF (YheA/YmcA/DUF963 family)
MKVYDAAHQLADAIKHNSDYLKYKKYHDMIENDQVKKKKLEKFQQLQLELQKAKLADETLAEDKIKETEAIYHELTQDPVLKEFLDAEYKVNQLLGDITKILSDTVDLD